MSKNNSSYGKLNVLKLLANGRGKVCFLGVGGVSMSALLVLSSYFGIHTFGCDKKENEYTNELRRRGECIFIGETELPYDTKLLVYTLAVEEDDPMILKAEKRGIPCVSRAEYMSALAEAYKNKIAVSGSHGKSTVTAMLHSIFICAGLNPTTLSGARLCGGGHSYHLGSLDTMIYEACEYKDSFLAFEPNIALFLNLEHDHVDYFENIDALEKSFLKAAQRSGVAIINTDDERLRKIAEKLYTPPITVGKNNDAIYKYELIAKRGGGVGAAVLRDGEYLGELTLKIIGEFNLLNAVMACAAATSCGIDFSTCRKALSEFSGIPCRLERVGAWHGRTVYFDYAHHPTEIESGIKAIKSDTGDDITVIFGPHTFSRTKALMDSFAASLTLADRLLITEIDAVREKNDGTVSAQLLAQKANGKVIRTLNDLESELPASSGAIVVMGAADLGWVKSFFMKSIDKC